MKKFLCLISLLFLCITLSSCNAVRKYNYDRIVAGDKEHGTLLSEIINLLGEPDVIKNLSPDVNHNSYYWFDIADTYDEAIALSKENKKVYYIAIMTNLSYEEYVYCVGKKAGYVTPDFVLGDINVYA